MATYIDREPAPGLALGRRPLVFQRGRGTLPLKGSRKRRTLRLAHVLALSALLAGFFLALDRAYLFLITWDQLTIRTVQLRCDRPAVRRDIERFLQARPLGNILLCDISVLRRELRTHSWVGDARVQKVFPATLQVEITERVPFALLEKGGLALVDREGNVLEPSASAEAWRLPIVRDEGGFREAFAEKWEAARDCLEALAPAERAGLLALDCADDGRMTLEFREDAVRLIVDGTDVRARLDRFAACRAALEGLFGALEYADLRLEDRIIVRPQEPASGADAAKSQKEAE